MEKTGADSGSDHLPAYEEKGIGEAREARLIDIPEDPDAHLSDAEKAKIVRPSSRSQRKLGILTSNRTRS